MSSMQSTSTFRLGANCSRYARLMPAPRQPSAYATAFVARLRDLAPYALLELILPGGSLMALLLWLYRRQKKAPGGAGTPSPLRIGGLSTLRDTGTPWILPSN